MRLRLTQLCGLLALGSSGACTPQHKAPEEPTEQSRAAAESKSAAQKSSADALPRPQGSPVSFEQELAQVAKVRGLAPKDSVEGLAVSPQELEAHVGRSLAFERPDNVLAGTEIMLAGLGLVPADFKLEQTIQALLAENLAGLYEPRLKLMLVRNDLPEQLAAVTLAHELVHALQDQYYDLQEIIEATPDDSDRSSALSCLAEGDATSAMIDAIAPAGRTAIDLPDSQIISSFFSATPQTPAPAIIVASLFAPYIDGLLFVHKLRRRGGFAEVDAAFEKPPLSTEHILHLDKYDSYESPLQIAVPAAPNSQYVELLHDIWGEQSLRLALEVGNDPAIAAAAAAGWGGDRIVAFSKKPAANAPESEQFAVAWHIEMDSAAEADELWKVLSQNAVPFSPGVVCQLPSESEADPGVAVTAENGPAVAMLRTPRGVYLLSQDWQRDRPQKDCQHLKGWIATLGSK